MWINVQVILKFLIYCLENLKVLSKPMFLIFFYAYTVKLLVTHMVYEVVLGCSFQMALTVIFTPQVNFMHFTCLNLFTVNLDQCKVFQVYHRISCVVGHVLSVRKSWLLD